MYWGLWIGVCIGFALRLLAGCFSFLFPFISFHPPISCHVPLGDEMDQYLNVDQWQKKPAATIPSMKMINLLVIQEGSE